MGFSISLAPVLEITLSDTSNFVSRCLEIRYAEDRLTDRIGTKHDWWISKGWEIGLCKILYGRMGHFTDTLGQRDGPTSGIGIRYGGISIDIARDGAIYSFPTKNHRISLSLSTFDKNNGNKYIAYGLSTLFPGAGNFYLGNDTHGFVYAGIATILSSLHPLGNNSRFRIYTTLYYLTTLVSLIDISINN